MHEKSSPVHSCAALLREGTGTTNDTNEWVYLSDGGHFENLGLYEMVWRRCQNIIVIDASADPHFTMEDLGNAFRKIYIDFGIPIEPVSPSHIGQGKGASNRHCAIYAIRYDCVHPGAAHGKLIYIKSSLCSNLPEDVRQYSVLHADFPHDPTFNQFFKEAQFESYRRLGSHIVEHILNPASPQALHPRVVTFDEFLRLLETYASNPPAIAAIVPTFTDMTEFFESGKARFTIRTS